MADSRVIEVQGVNLVPYKSGMKYPKLGWIMMMLDKYGVPHAVRNTGLKGSMFYVQQGSVELVHGILHQELVSFNASTLNHEEGKSVKISVVIDDLPDDHEFFEAQLEGYVQTDTSSTLVVVEPVGEVIEVTESKATAEASVVVEEEEIVPDASPEPADEDETDDDDDAETESWFSDDDPVVEEEGPVIDVEATVEDVTDVEDEGESDDEDEFVGVESDPVYSKNIVTGDEFLRIDTSVPFQMVELPGVKAPVKMYDVNSSTISAVGCRELSKTPLNVVMYVRFKSSGPLSYYRYNPVQKSDYNNILNEIVRTHEGVKEASVGSLFHHTIKVKAEDGDIKAQKLKDDQWYIVPTKAERTKDIKLRSKRK